MYQICFYFLMFFCYSVLGWLVECICCTLERKKPTFDRGFLVGPYCPIYGYGAMYMYFFLSKYKSDFLVLFIMAIVGTSTIEFFTSYFMEKIFKARWWDYSSMKYNLDGRICLRNSFLFGVLGVLFIYIINPIFLYLFQQIPEIILIIISSILFIIFTIDTIVSFSIMTKLRINLQNLKKDSTSYLDQEVKKILSNNSFYLKKLFHAFPKVKLILPKGEKIISSIQKTLNGFDSLGKERRKKIQEIKEEYQESRKRKN